VNRPGSPCDAALGVTQITLGKFKVGITGLKEAIAAVQALGLQSDQEIAQALLERLKPLNYIPPGAQEDYKRAFVREYKKALGLPVPEEETGPVIKILGPGCPNCRRLEELVMEVLAELNLAVAVETVKDLNEIAAHGVFGTPALIINKEIKAMGKVPSREALKEWFSRLVP
jgi:small redox-active disulfide protein 2